MHMGIKQHGPHPFLHVEAEFDDVAVLHDVVLAFQSHKALSRAACLLPQATRSS